MSGMSWFKCYPRDFNDGMIGLTLEERGAYVSILNVIYARGGPIPDDASYFRALLCVSGKGWSKVRAALVVKRKIYEVSIDGFPHLMNERAAKELEKSRKLSRNFSEAAQRRWSEREGELSEINDLEDGEALGRQWVGNANQKPEPEPEREVVDDTRESRFENGSDWPEKPLDALVAETLSPFLDTSKTPGLITSSGRLVAWRRSGASWVSDVVPVVAALCSKAKGPINSWSYFDTAIAQSIANNRRDLSIPDAAPPRANGFGGRFDAADAREEGRRQLMQEMTRTAE